MKGNSKSKRSMCTYQLNDICVHFTATKHGHEHLLGDKQIPTSTDEIIKKTGKINPEKKVSTCLY